MMISLKAARVNANMTQESAAARLGVCKKTINRYESGAAVPPWDKAVEMGRLYGWPAEFIDFSRKFALSEKKEA
jgi:DNA-binding XRE family transcriptional regulator